MADDAPLFGQPATSPAALQYQRQLAQKLSEQGLDASPIRSPWQGVARMFQSGLGAFQALQANRSEQQARQSSAQNLANALRGNDIGGAVGAMSDPFTNPEAAKLVAALMTPQPVDTGLGQLRVDRFGRPIPGSYIPKQQVVTPEYGPGIKIPEVIQGTSPEGGYRQIQPGPPGGVSQPAQAQPNLPAPEGQGGIMPGGEQIMGGGAAPPIDPMTQAKIRLAQGLQAQAERLKTMGQKAGDIAMTPAEEVAKEIRTAPQALNAINVIEDVAKTQMARGTTTGLAGEPMLKLRQTINGLAGHEVLGETAGPETMKKMNAYLASAATQAMTARGTQFDFKVNMENQPGNLMNSWKGTLYLSNIMKQIHRQNLELGQQLQQGNNVYNSASVIKNYYDTHPLMDPVTGNKLGVSQDTGEQKGGPRVRRYNPQTGGFEEVSR